MRKLLQQQNGWSLIKLIITIVILGILAAIIISNVSHFLAQLSNNATDNTTQNITIDRIIIGQLKTIDYQGDYTFLYFDQGPRIIVTTKSLSLTTNGTDPFHYIWTYEFMEAGRFALDNYYYLIHTTGQEGQ